MARKSRVNIAPQVVEEVFSIYLAGLYTRLSVEADGEDQESNSLANQKKLGIHYLSDHPDIKLVDTYSDNGYTGMNYERPDFQRMMEDLRRGRINCVIVKDISRLGRHFTLTSEFVERAFPEMGVRLICINDSFDSEDPQADSAALTLPLKMVMNDYYVKDIAKKIRSGINAKIDSGTYIPSASSIPYGYIRNPELVTFDVDEETAPVVKRIFELRATGMSLNGIATVLNREGIPCPGKLRYVRGVSVAKKYENANWTRGTLRKILSDEVYLGHRVHGRIKGNKYGDAKVKRDSEEWNIVRNAHPAIISQELFDRAQEVAEETAEKRQAFGTLKAPNVDYRDIFKGKVFCGHCGAYMSSGKGSGRETSAISVWIYYDCNTYRYSNHTKCFGHYIRQETIMEAVSDLLDQQILTAVDVDELLTRLQRKPTTNLYQTRAHELYMSAVTRRKGLEAKLDQLLINLSQRFIDRTEYEYFKKKYEAQLEELISAEAEALADKNAWETTVAASKKWIQAIYRYKKIPEVTPELVDVLIDRIEVVDGKSVRIKLKYNDPYRSIKALEQRMERVRNAG